MTIPGLEAGPTPTTKPGSVNKSRVAIVLLLSSTTLLGLSAAVAVRFRFDRYPYAINLVRGQYDWALPHEKALRRLPELVIEPGDEIEFRTKYIPDASGPIPPEHRLDNLPAPD